jgi:hypothetical protein
VTRPPLHPGLLATLPVAAGDRALVTATGGGTGVLLVQLARPGARSSQPPGTRASWTLEQAPDLHRAIEGREVVGKALLIP